MHPDEESYVPKKIKEIMEDISNVINHVPMVAEVEMTDTNWSEKKGVDL